VLLAYKLAQGWNSRLTTDAGRTRRVPRERVPRPGGPVLDAHFAARDAVLAAAKSVDPAKDGDLEDRHLALRHKGKISDRELLNIELLESVRPTPQPQRYDT
jgi:hypothetical protein